MLLAAVVTLSIGLAPFEGWLALAAVLAVAAYPLRTILFQRGKASVRRFEWRADGTWQVVDATGTPKVMRLAPQTAAFGPWVLLIWSASPQPCRRYALIDAAAVGPRAFRALRGRLSLTSRHREACADNDNC